MRSFLGWAVIVALLWVLGVVLFHDFLPALLLAIAATTLLWRIRSGSRRGGSA